MSDESCDIPAFVPIFPLPRVVLFPRVILPLHVFEPRYRAMTGDALDGAGLIAVALLKPGFEPLYYTRRAPIHPVIGVGRILESEQVDDGNYNLLLRGMARAEIVDEVRDRDYRVAKIEVLSSYCSGDPQHAAVVREDIVGAIQDNAALPSDVRSYWLRLANADVELDALCDVIAAGVPIDAELRQLLLEERDALARGRMLTDQLRTVGAVARNQRREADPGGLNFN